MLMGERSEQKRGYTSRDKYDKNSCMATVGRSTWQDTEQRVEFIER